MLIIGLTGGIATGKTTVSQCFKDLGIPVIDSDQLARDALKQGTPGYRRVIREFAHLDPNLVLTSGEIDRLLLGRLVFNNNTLKKKLEGIVHPHVKWHIALSVLKYFVLGYSQVIIDVPLLFEAGLYKFCSKIITVYCPPDVALIRLRKRQPQLSHEDALSRINAQLSIEKKAEMSDIVIDNSINQKDSRGILMQHCQNLLSTSLITPWWKTFGWWLLGIAPAIFAMAIILKFILA